MKLFLFTRVSLVAELRDLYRGIHNRQDESTRVIYDTIIVGSGAGGAVLATRLAERGDRVLVIEQGDWPAHGSPSSRVSTDQLEEVIEVQGQRVQPFLGRMVGGSTGLYGSVLLRPSASDFTPGRFYADYLERALWEWPLSPDELSPYWTEAENLMQVSGDQAQSVPFLERRSSTYQKAPIALTASNQNILDRMQSRGYQAFRLPLAIAWDQCQRCGTCPGQLCPTQARSSSWTARASNLERTGALHLLARHKVERLVHKARKIEGVWVKGPQGLRLVKAERYVMAAGAIGTASLLLRSEIYDQSGQLGRNFMFHLGVACLSLGSKGEWANHSFQKQLGLADFYEGTPAFPHKLGLAQSIPLPHAEMLQDKLGKAVPRSLLRILRSHIHLFVLMVEDLPQAQNRVRVGPEGIKLEHGYHSYDHFRAQGAKQLLTQVFRSCGWPLSFAYAAVFEKQHLGHQVGTCRMGFDPRTSVVDTNAKVHAYDNLFVGDGSWLPNSLGVGPALTIMAQALRLADHLGSSIERTSDEKSCDHGSARESWSSALPGISGEGLGSLGSGTERL